MVGTSGSKETERDLRYLFFLNRIKEDFTNQDDPMAATYQKGLKTATEKAKLYAIYMQFVEAELLRCQASISQREGRGKEAAEYNEKARSILSQFADKTNSAYYLKLRAKSSLSALRRSQLV